MPKTKYEKQKYGMEKATPRLLTEEELSFIEGRTTKKQVKRDEDEVTLNNEDKVVPVPGGGFMASPTPDVNTVAPVQPTINQVASDPDNTIVINEVGRQVELSFETSVPRPDGTTKPVTFSVSIYTSSIYITDDGISILTRSDIDIKPPALIPLILTVDNKDQYEVIYAGGKHKFGKFTNISFVKLDV